jgi:hypothetical protein
MARLCIAVPHYLICRFSPSAPQDMINTVKEGAAVIKLYIELKLSVRDLEELTMRG